MAGWREQKRAALADVHGTFEVPAVYITQLGGAPVPVRVRLHRKHDRSLPVEGDDWSNALSNVTLIDRIIFEAAEVGGKVFRHAIVIFSATEAYYTAAASPVRDGYIPVEVSRVAQRELDDYLDASDPLDPAWATIQ